VIVALLRKQPQEMDGLCKSAGISVRTFYRIRPSLEEIIKETRNGYVLWNFSELDWEVKKAIKKLWDGHRVTLNAIANEMGFPPSEIESAVYRAAKELEMEVRVLSSGEKIIVKKGYKEEGGKLLKAF